MGSNSKNSKLNNFIIQGGILAFAGVLVRMLGLVKRIPLSYIIGDVGNSYYSAAYEIYNIVLTISSYGIPLSVSKLVAARVNKGHFRNANKVFHCALIFALCVGSISSVLVFTFSRQLSIAMNEPMSNLALMVLSPTLFIVAIMGVFRGYFQGLGTMVPTACSQLIEQIILITVSLSSSYMLTKRGARVGAILQNPNYANAYGAAGATLGCSVGAAAGLLFLIYIYKGYSRKLQKQIYKDPSHTIESTSTVFIALICTIVPVVLSNTVNNISNFLDQYLYNRIMVEKGLLDIKSINWGIYSGKYLVLIGVPIAMANAMGASSVPTVAGIMKRKAYDEARDKISKVIRITMLISIPCAVGIAVLSPSLMYFLFSSTNETGPILLRIGALGIVLFSFSTLTNGLLQGMSHLREPITHALIALLIHVCILILLLKFTNLNIYAVAFSNNIFSFVICVLNLISIRKILNYRQEYIRTFVIPFISATIMGVVCYLVSIPFTANGYSRLLIMVNILIGCIVYFASMVILKGITETELNQLPGGRKIYSLMKRLHLMR